MKPLSKLDSFSSIFGLTGSSITGSSKFPNSSSVYGGASKSPKASWAGSSKSPKASSFAGVSSKFPKSSSGS
jgi:hypothetical protein